VEQGGSDELDILPLQNKLRELLDGVSAQMLAEDGITVASYMAGMDDTGASLCSRKVSKWAAAAQDRFTDTIHAPTAAPPAAGLTETQFETAPALLPSAVPERKPAPAPVPGPLGAAQPAEPAPKLATQRPAEPLLPQSTQVELPEVLPSLQEPAVVNVSPPPDLQLEQMSASEVSVLATRLGTPEWLKFRSQVAAWLQSINLGRYAPFVEENKVDGCTLLDFVQVTRLHLLLA
jgi:hypothetical protein